jgi:prepilin-type N-terminal cleavage/methylation domain-containing protein/prepilin-type processing-associated H-X9-DG protein
MARTRSRGFTLIELLVVIGIIAILLGLLLAALGKARDQANAIKCSANLHSIGESLAQYISDNHFTFPASYIYQYMSLTPPTQSPQIATWGYVHWSSYLYKYTTNTDPTIYGKLFGWEMFQCPSLLNGGLPATNTFPENAGAFPGCPQFDEPATSLGHDWSSGWDLMAPRMAYTLNEALCPRNKFVLNFSNHNLRTCQWVRTSMVKHSSSTILATEFPGNWNIVSAPGDNNPSPVSKAHRPISGFIAINPGGQGPWDLPSMGPAGGGLGFGGGATLPSYERAIWTDLQANPTVPAVNTTLDWVGRNHGVQKVDSSGWFLGTSNFLYVDGHVETKSVRETINDDPNRGSAGFEWGDDIYSLNPHGDLLNP